MAPIQEKNPLLTIESTTSEITVQVLLNDAFIHIYDSNYPAAVACFKSILRIKPLSLVVMNNIAVCQIFNNQSADAIEVLQSLIKSRGKEIITEQLVTNMLAFLEVQFPSGDKVDKLGQ